MQVKNIVCLMLLLGILIGGIGWWDVSHAAPIAALPASSTMSATINVAQGKMAGQSSTHESAGASRAVDGNTDGNYLNNSVTLTAHEVNPWWQVDLGSQVAIDTITLWNRTECCVNRMTNFFVFVANYDMTGKNFGDLVVDNTVWRYSLGTTAPPTLHIPVNTAGRYVRVQLAGTDRLQLAEVQVFGTLNVAQGNGTLNVAQGKMAGQSSTHESAGASRAVDGNTNGNYYNNSVSHTRYEVNPWWQVDLGSKMAIDTITLWNRTDCCSNRLTNFFVFVADYDMTGKHFGDLVVDSTVWRYSLGTTAPTTLNIPVNTSGRYVRVQLAGTETLQLAEVQVFGTAVSTMATMTTDFENGTLGMFAGSVDARVTTDAYSSQKAALIDRSGNVMALRSNLRPGTKVTVNAWVKGIGTAYVSFGRSNGSEISNVYRSNSSTTWRYVSFSGLVPAEAVTTELVFRADSGAFLVDNVAWSIEEPWTLAGRYRLEMRGSGKCLEVAGKSLINGGNVQLWRCDPTAKHHQWRFEAVNGDYYKILNVNSGKALTVYGNGTADRTQIDQWDDVGQTNQQWKPVLQSDGSYQLVAKHSNKCADIAGASTSDGANLQQYACHTGNNQRFHFVPIPQTIVTDFEDNTLGLFNRGHNSGLTTDAESGQKAATAATAGNSIAAHYPIRPETPISVIAWVKGSGTAYVSFARGDFSEISNRYRTVNSTNWQQILFSGTAPAGTSYYDLVFRADNGPLSVDNIVVTLNERDTDGDGLLDRVESCSNSGSLNYEFYDGAVAGNSLTNLPTTGALAQGITTDFDVQRIQNQVTPFAPHDYGIRYSGYLWITKAGDYTFFTNSDDGSRLLIDQRLVVNNDGSHPLTERNGTVHLYAGLHHVQLLYSAYGTPNSLAVQWSGPSFGKVALPFNRLLSCDPNLDSDGDGIPNYLDLDSDDDTIPDALENLR